MKLAHYIEREGLTHAQFAEAAKLSRETVSKAIAHGASTRSVARKIVAATGGEVSEAEAMGFEVVTLRAVVLSSHQPDTPEAA